MEEIYTFTIKEKLLQRKYAIIKDKAFNPQVCLVNTFWTQRERNREFFYFFLLETKKNILKEEKIQEKEEIQEKEKKQEKDERSFPQKQKLNKRDNTQL